MSVPQSAFSRLLWRRSSPTPGKHNSRASDHLQSSTRQWRNFRTSRALREEKPEEQLSPERQSFRGQLYESTANRLARERAEEERFAQLRMAKGSATAVTFATTFGKFRLFTVKSFFSGVEVDLM